MNQNLNGQQADLQKLLATQEGQKLIRLLSQSGGKTMAQAGSALKQGDTRRVQELMTPLMQDPEVRRLLAALEKSMGHG